MNRAEALDRVRNAEEWDLVVIGGGATGVGIALDAASRGYEVLLLERGDFGKGTSSRSTKLVHGGVRYLKQGNVPLVMEALEERGILRANAPHLVSDLQFIVPNYEWWEAPFYGIGMKVYDLLAGRWGFGRSRILSQKQTIERLPTIRREGLRGGVIYHDGQFDDARLLIAMARTADEQGATLLNYVEVTGVERGDDGLVNAVSARDVETDDLLRVRARRVINATGPFADAVRRLDEPTAAAMIAPSRGVHIVLDGSFLPGDSAIMVPHTSDGRVLFAIPWQRRTLIGTTDTAVDDVAIEPVAGADEIDFLLETAGAYLSRKPTRADVRSVFAGIRPLARATTGGGETAAISREHVITVSKSGLLTIAGGKWTTYRKMAEECVDHAATLAKLERRPCVTRDLHLHGWHDDAGAFGDLALYGADAPEVGALCASRAQFGERLHPELAPLAGEVIWSARHEWARTVEDFLSRRSRALLLDARAAVEAAPRVASLLAEALERDERWERAQVEAFEAIARGYILSR